MVCPHRCCWNAPEFQVGFAEIAHIALNCSLSVKKDVGLSFAHFLDTAYIQL